MHFDDQAIRSRGDGGSCHRSDLVAFTGTVAGIDEYRQMTQALYRRNDAEVQRVTRVISKCAHTSLTQYDVVIAFTHDVLSSHQELLEGCRHTSFKKNGFLRAPSALQQRKVLHVTRADL